MKGVLMSIRPEWCELIASGKKTVEIRKTIPRKFVQDRFYSGYLTEPFKVYIYETQGYSATPQVFEDGTTIFQGRGKVIGEFVCDEVVELAPLNRADDTMEEKACMSREEIARYLKGKGYAWYISDLVIYDKPKELGEFTPNCRYLDGDDECRHREVDCHWQKFDFNPDLTVNVVNCTKRLTRPPQSWCYVEVV